EQLVVVGLVPPSRPARGMDAGRAVEGVHLEARVVGQRPLPRVTGDLHGLLARVGGEAVAVLDDFGKPGILDDGDRKIGVDLADLADLALVLRGDDDLPGHSWTVARRLTASRSRSSVTVRATRMKPSAAAPNPDPGSMMTPALSASSANCIDVAPFFGTGYQM